MGSVLSSRRFRRRSLIATAAAGLTLVLAACGGTSGASGAATSSPSGLTNAQLVSKAKSEGKVVVYTALPDAVQQALNTAFQNKYGIQVTSQRLIAGDFDNKVQAEFTAGQHITDLLIGQDESAFEQWETQGKLAAPPASAMPATKDWPAKYRSKDTFSVQTNFYGILYNTDKVSGSAVPKTWQDLLKSPVAGQLLLIDPHNGTASELQYELLLKKYGADFLTKLGKQAHFINSGVPATQNVGAGSATYYAPAVPPLLPLGLSTGLHLAISYPTPSVGASVREAVTAGAPDADAAALFEDFSLSSDGQAIINKDGYSAAANVPGTKQLPTGLVAADYTGTVADNDKIVQLLGG